MYRTVIRILVSISSFRKDSDRAVTANFVAGYMLNAPNAGGGILLPR